MTDKKYDPAPKGQKQSIVSEAQRGAMFAEIDRREKTEERNIKTATSKELDTRLDEIILKSGGMFGTDTRTDKEKTEQKEIVAELNKRKPKEKEEDSGDIEFIMSSKGIGKAMREQQPKHAHIKDWFEQTLSSDYRGTGQGKRHITLIEQVDESDKAVKIKIVIRDALNQVIRTEDKWFPKKAIENIEMLK